MACHVLLIKKAVISKKRGHWFSVRLQEWCVLKTRQLPEFPLPSHPTRFHALGPTDQSLSAAGHQSMLCKGPCVHPGTLQFNPHLHFRKTPGPSSFFGTSCAAGYEVMALDGVARTEHRFHNNNSISRPKHQGNLSHPLSLGIRFAWPAREACMFNFINAINHSKDSVITFYALLTFMHCSA